MALEVEDGTGKANAESYASVADADTRLAALGYTTWASDTTTTEREEALRRATQYMLQRFRARWKGSRASATQALDWPRYSVSVDGYPVDTDIVPADVANACIDLAFKAAAGDLNPDIERAIVEEQVGPLRTRYSEYGAQTTRYQSADQLLAPYLQGGGAARLVRA